MRVTRRDALIAAAAAAAGCGRREPAPLSASEFTPRSMLVVPETRVERPRHPVIDIHTHLGWADAGGGDVPLALSGKRYYGAAPGEIAALMDELNIAAAANLTGGYGPGLREGVQNYDRKFPGRFFTVFEPMFDRVNRPDYARMQAEAVAEAHAEGARGLKIPYALGLHLREGVTVGPLVEVDDPRFDPMWEACGALGLPVAMHVTEPSAFYIPIDRSNERYEQLREHPEWSLSGTDRPSKMAVLEARNRVLARHPGTRFVGLHVATLPENLAVVSEWMDRYPNLWVDIAGQAAELGWQPRTAAKFFDRYQDRILFGTDMFPNGRKPEYAARIRQTYSIWARLLETEDEYFEYSSGPAGRSGRWRIYGLGLSDGILRKLYSGNARRLLGIG